MKIKTKISLTDEEFKRWNDAYAIMREVYEALPCNCEIEAMLGKAVGYFEDFTLKYVEN